MSAIEDTLPIGIVNAVATTSKRFTVLYLAYTALAYCTLHTCVNGQQTGFAILLASIPMSTIVYQYHRYTATYEICSTLGDSSPQAIGRWTAKRNETPTPTAACSAV
ncbi:hypothetical protein Dda_7851 [Drechslerella dactyloides]|uniref:Uncharacterized protein n=1 Tax=Drechslerella dactyloides TaxID=74499 RepID=A0AAD6IQZ5_DREDA|nr:hypothetical protein Dda_7851 [Drechslerella dactyloides]